MTFLELLLLSTGLCMDSFAVAISSGMTHHKNLLRHAIKIGTSFAAFQMITPIIGWYVGIQLRTIVEGIDHWIAFSLLLYLGGKMLWDAWRKKTKNLTEDECSLGILCYMALATSIDAFVVGISFAFIRVAIIPAATIIGIMTFLFAFFGVLLGRKIGSLFGNYVTYVGGILLIAIGVKILLEHLY